MWDNPSSEWAGSEKKVDTTEPVFVACINNPVHREYYAKVEAAETYYALHKSKSDPLRYDAINAVRSARRAFRMKVNVMYMEAAPTLPPTAREIEAAAWRAEYYRQDTQLVRCIEEAARRESEFRSMIEHPDYWRFPYEWEDRDGHMGTKPIAHRHAIYATLMGFLEREGVPGFEREWHGWAGELLGQGDKLHEREVTTYSSYFDENGQDCEEEADVETDHTYPHYIGPPPTKAEIRKAQRHRKAQMEGDPSNSKAAKKMRKWRAAKKVNSDILKRAAEFA